MIEQNISLKPYNTFGIDVKALAFGRFGSVNELKSLLSERDKQVPLFILGGGSNFLLTRDLPLTVERFLAIQAMGSEHARNDIRQLRHWLAERPAPQLAALEAGLGLLADVDLRDALVGLDLPWLRIYGRLDSLVPKAAIPLLDERYPASHSLVLEKASHAPFISHPQQFVEIIRHFVG